MNGKYIGSYCSEQIPFWAHLAIRIGWLRRRYARHNVSEIKVYEEGIVLTERLGSKQQEIPLTEIRRIWFEEFHTGSEAAGNLSFRIDLIAQNLDVIFRLTNIDCKPNDETFLLMRELYQRWKAATWKHHHVVAAIVEHPENASGGEPRFLCMQKGDTRYAYTSRHWEFPGGKVEQGETEQEALHRELQEEMDYEVTVGQHLITVEHRYPDFGITLSCWLCKAETEDFCRKEHIDHRWLTIAEMQELEWCAADAPVLEQLSVRFH